MAEAETISYLRDRTNKRAIPSLGRFKIHGIIAGQQPQGLILLSLNPMVVAIHRHNRRSVRRPRNSPVA